MAPRKKAPGKPARKVTRQKRGRPPIEIDWEAVEEMCQCWCLETEICNILNISMDTMNARCKKKFGVNFSEWRDQKADGGRLSLRRAQKRTAESGNPTMQIWLGKQVLGQTDRLEQKIEHHGIGPVVIPDNKRDE